jgi:hypothetical protein
MAFNVKWLGASRRPYEFTVYPDGQPFNPVSAVYIFCRPAPGGLWEALYVGETDSLQRRLNHGIANHDGYWRAKRLGMTHIAALSVAGDAERLRIETDLRHGLSPVANVQGASRGITNA